MGFLTPTEPNPAYFADQKSNHWSPMRTLHHFQDPKKPTPKNWRGPTSLNVLCCGFVFFFGGSSS